MDGLHPFKEPIKDLVILKPNYVLSNSGLIDQSVSFQLGLNRQNYGFEFFVSSVNTISELLELHIYMLQVIN